MKSKYSDFLNDSDVKQWYNNVARGSKITADVYLRRFGSFCHDNNVTPKQIIKLSDKEREKLIFNTIDKMTSDGNAGSYIQAHLKAIKSWLAWNDIVIKKKVKINGTNRRPSLRDEAIPDQNELKKILNAADSRERTAISLIAFSGLRPETLGNYKGTDGLRISDIPEVVITEDTVSFQKTPAMIVVREELSKTGNRYFTFLGPEGCSYLKAYLESRLKHGETLTKDSPVLVPVRRKPAFIVTNNIGNMIRSPMRLAGNKNRPYVFRSYFDTQTMLAEMRGFLRDYRTFFMGHKGDIEHTYTLNKNHLSSDLIEKMREAYTAALPYLETTFEPRTVNDAISEAYRQLATEAFNVPETEVVGKSIQEISALIRANSTNHNGLIYTLAEVLNVDVESVKKMGHVELIDKLVETYGGERPQRKQLIVLKKDVPSYLERGYIIDQPFDDSSVVMLEPPNHKE